mgnify:CR=1 FL=1
MKMPATNIAKAMRVGVAGAEGIQYVKTSDGTGYQTRENTISGTTNSMTTVESMSREDAAMSFL